MRSENTQTLKCEHCDTKSSNVGASAEKWICHRCVAKSMRGSLDLDSDPIKESK